MFITVLTMCLINCQKKRTIDSTLIFDIGILLLSVSSFSFQLFSAEVSFRRYIAFPILASNIFI